MPYSNAGLKAQIEVYLGRCFEQVFSFHKFLQVYTTKKTKETVLDFKQNVSHYVRLIKVSHPTEQQQQQQIKK